MDDDDFIAMVGTIRSILSERHRPVATSRHRLRVRRAGVTLDLFGPLTGPTDATTRRTD
jgi:hypothetical protein